MGMVAARLSKIYRSIPNATPGPCIPFFLVDESESILAKTPQRRQPFIVFLISKGIFRKTRRKTINEVHGAAPDEE